MFDLVFAQMQFKYCQKVTNLDYFQAFLEGVCHYSGNILEHLDSLATEDQCQLACLFHRDCQYFVYNHDIKECELHDSGKRNCNVIKGPPSPTYEECQPTTTTSKTTTSTTTTTTTSMTTPDTTTTMAEKGHFYTVYTVVNATIVLIF